MIHAEVIAHSINDWGKEIMTVKAVMPRIVLAELNTHRMLSRNSASSRAIPFGKMADSVRANPFIPIAWQKVHAGMQGKEYFTDKVDIDRLLVIHSRAVHDALVNAAMLNAYGATKQMANRYLEPYAYHTVLITATEWTNFFNLRCPQYTHPKTNDLFKSRKEWEFFNRTEGGNLPVPQTDIEWLLINTSDAEIHIQAVAEAIYTSIQESKPELLKVGEYHIPYKAQIKELYPGISVEDSIEVSTVMCARVSYTVADVDLSEWTLEKYKKKYNDLVTAKPLHASPLEHVNRNMTVDEYLGFYRGDQRYENDDNEGWCYNMKAYIPLRYLVERGLFNRKEDVK